MRDTLPQGLSGEGRLHRLGRHRESHSGVLRRRRQHRDALQLPRRRPRAPLPRGMHGLGRPRPLGLDGRRARLFARHLRGAAAPADRAPRERARDPAGFVHGRQRRHRARGAPSAAGQAPHPQRHRPLHPEEAPPPALADARAPLRLPRPGRPLAQDRRLAEERRPDQRRHPLQRDLPPDPVARRGRRPRLPPRCARAAWPIAPMRRKASTSGRSGARCAARCC